MTYYGGVHLQSNSMDYSGSLQPILSSYPLQSTHKIDNVEVPDASHLLADSLCLASSMDGSIPPENELQSLASTSWAASNSAAAFTAPYYHYPYMSTPPPECNRFQQSYQWSNHGLSSIPLEPMLQPVVTEASQLLVNNDPFVLGTSLDESPISSPSSSEECYTPQRPEDGTYAHLPPLHLSSKYVAAPTTSYNYMAGPPVYGQPPTLMCSQEPYHSTMQAPRGVKMPQRKGGIQLWQFLYSLLTSNDSKHREVIKWTSNKHEREFRMLEPESIAVWWGHHKNKPNMSYDKFSRSLRYYYDKGILKKIPGERYVYRFLIDPEEMYHHIGTSDCRPKLKPMPQAAKLAMSKYDDSSIDLKSSTPIITQEAEPLSKSFAKESETIQSTNIITSNTPKSCVLFSTSDMQKDSKSTGNTGIPEDTSITSLSMRRSRSLECANSSKRKDLLPQTVLHSSMDLVCDTQMPHNYPEWSSYLQEPLLSASSVEASTSNHLPTYVDPLSTKTLYYSETSNL